MEVGHLCIGGRLGLEGLVQAAVVLLQRDDTILKMTGGFLRHDSLILKRQLSLINDTGSTVEQVKHKLKP